MASTCRHRRNALRGRRAADGIVPPRWVGGVWAGGTLQADMERGSRGVISFGIAGGLAPNLLPGQWVVASAIVSDHERHVPDARWSERLLQALPGARHAMIAGADAPVADPRA